MAASHLETSEKDDNVPHSVDVAVELIPGYSCTERIGAGGYGEVWKIDAPGGFKKAIKIVYGFVGEERAEREIKALERIKGIRHPYMLSLERVEIREHRLLIVSELADCSLLDRFLECRQQGLNGLPRNELIRHLREAAEALDYLWQQHGLQHLDIKPENLLLLCGHAKVADFGMVKDLFDQSHSLVSGLTPIYAAPEALHGNASRWSDQYSLAVVYQHMLTGTLPFPGRHVAQLVSQHAKLEPLLSALPDYDRAIVGRALRQQPESRFESCSAFVEALRTQDEPRSGPSTSSMTTLGEETNASEKDTLSNSGILTELAAMPQARSDDREQTQKFPGPAREGVPCAPAPRVAAATQTPQIRVSRHVRLLHPLRRRPPDTAVGPTVLIGIGGTGARVLSMVRARLQTSPDSASIGSPRFLLLETDIRMMETVIRANESSALKHNDCLYLPLRRPEELRRESDRYLAWLSRRWLYNIRPSLVTNGLRPLGRLAWFDHLERVNRALTERLLARDPSVISTSDMASTKKNAPTAPQVFLIGSISGGTGGMVLDVAKSASQVLRDAGYRQPLITALFVHSTTAHPQQQALANANAFATLNELRHLTCHGETIQTRMGLRAPPKSDSPWNPFLTTYYLPLGENLNAVSYEARLGDIADYLAANLRTSLGRLLDTCRQEGLPPARHDAWMRSFKQVPVDSALVKNNDLTELGKFLQSATVSLPGCGYDRRLLLLVPEQQRRAGSWLDLVEKVADVVYTTDHRLQLCCEAKRVSLVQVARTLSQDCPEVEQAAYRLHTRRDIDWSEMTGISSVTDDPMY